MGAVLQRIIGLLAMRGAVAGAQTPSLEALERKLEQLKSDTVASGEIVIDRIKLTGLKGYKHHDLPLIGYSTIHRNALQ